VVKEQNHKSNSGGGGTGQCVYEEGNDKGSTLSWATHRDAAEERIFSCRMKKDGGNLWGVARPRKTPR